MGLAKDLTSPVACLRTPHFDYRRLFRAPSVLYKFVYTILLLSIFVAAQGVAAAEVRYPENPYIGRDDIFISFDGVHAYRRDDLKKRWSALLGEHTFEPVAHQHLLLVGSSRGLYALRANDGSVLWQVETDNEIFTPVVVNGVAYAGSRNGTLYAFDATAGGSNGAAVFPVGSTRLLFLATH